MAKKSTPNPNWALLGGLRFVLASIVMCCHGLYFFGVERTYMKAAVQFGSFTAVLAFFVVSGFSIRASIERETKGFYLRRFHRIAPVYYTCFVLALVLMTQVGTMVSMDKMPFWYPTRREFLSSLLLLNNITGGLFHTIGQSWSLTLECIYYLAAPLLLRLPLRTTLAVAALSGAYYAKTTLHYPTLVGVAPIFGLCWAWLAGWLMHHLRSEGAWSEGAWSEGAWSEGSASEGSASPILPSVVMMAPLVLLLAWNPNAGRFSALTMSVTILCLLYGHRVVLSERLSRVLSYLGELSYPLYLCHTIAAITLWHFAHVRTPEPFLVAALLLAALIYHGVELPYRKLVRRLGGRRQVPHSESAAARTA